MKLPKGVLVELYDERTDKQLCRADILFGLNVFTVLDCDNWTIEKLAFFLESRIPLFQSYDMDDMVLKKLDLMERKRDFGRMSEASVLYSLLCNFKSDSDEIGLYPLKTEIVSMIDLDARYSNLYIWRPRNDTYA